MQALSLQSLWNISERTTMHCRSGNNLPYRRCKQQGHSQPVVLRIYANLRCFVGFWIHPGSGINWKLALVLLAITGSICARYCLASGANTWL